MLVVFFVELAAIFFFASFGGATQSSLQTMLGVPDWALHCAAFLAAAVTAMAIWTSIWWITSLLGAASGLVEIMQWFVPGRTPSWSDFGASLVGVVLGIAAVTMIRRWASDCLKSSRGAA